MLYELSHPLIAPVIKAWWKPVVSGVENIPRSGPVILAANHLSNVDPFIVPVLSPRKVRYIIKADYWHQKGVRARIKQWFFEEIGSIPVERGSLRQAQESLEKAKAVLDSCEVFGIYPEGTRSKTGKLGKGHQGVAWLVENTKAQVIPVGLKNTDKLFNGSKLPKPRTARIEVHFGEAIDFSPIYEKADEISLPERRKAITELIMEEIQKLSGQERS